MTSRPRWPCSPCWSAARAARSTIEAKKAPKVTALRDDRAGEAAMAEDPQVDDRVLVGQLPDQEGDEADRGDEGQRAR